LKRLSRKDFVRGEKRGIKVRKGEMRRGIPGGRKGKYQKRVTAHVLPIRRLKKRNCWGVKEGNWG